MLFRSLPMLAPITRPMATGKLMTPAPARVAFALGRVVLKDVVLHEQVAGLIDPGPASAVAEGVAPYDHVLAGLLDAKDPDKKSKEIEIKLIARLKKHAGNPKFKELGERLEKIRERHEQGLLNSLEFLKAILEVAKDTVEAENKIDPEEEKDQALAARTELFNEVKSKQTHVIVERLVADIDGIVRQIRFDGWQTTSSGEREVKQALRSALRKYKLHTDQDLFDKAYGYIREYY